MKKLNMYKEDINLILLINNNIKLKILCCFKNIFSFYG